MCCNQAQARSSHHRNHRNERFPISHGTNYFCFVNCFSFLFIYSIEYRFERFRNILEGIAKVGLFTFRYTLTISLEVFPVCRSCNQGTSGGTAVRMFNRLPIYSKSNRLVLQKNISRYSAIRNENIKIF